MMRKLPKVLIRNSFNILGLSSTSAQKDIRKRVQQLLQLAKIQEIQDFETDVGQVCEFRREDEIRQAMERISSIKERLGEVFFWFEDHSMESKKVFSLISKQKYREAVEILEGPYENNIDWLSYKNLALSYCFDASYTSDINSFKRALQIWKKILESDHFWNFYKKRYLFYDELGTSPKLFQEFRNKTYNFLSKYAISLYHQIQNPRVIAIYYEVFNQVGKYIDDEIVQPVIIKIKNEIDVLRTKVTDKECSKLASEGPLETINELLLELEKFELHEYSPLSVLRDETAKEIRSLAITCNKNGCNENALILLNQCTSLGASQSIAMKIEADIKVLTNNIAWDAVYPMFKTLEEFISKRQFKNANIEFLKIDEKLARKHDLYSKNSRIILLNKFCQSLILKGIYLYEEKKFNITCQPINFLLNIKSKCKSIKAFKYALKLIYDRIIFLNFNKYPSDKNNLVEEVERITEMLRYCSFSKLLENFKSCLDRIYQIANEQSDINTKISIELLGSALCHSILSARLTRNFRYKVGPRMILIATIAAFMFFAWILDVIKNNLQENSNYQPGSSYSSSSSQILKMQENEIIDYLKVNEPNLMAEFKKRGYSDKQIVKVIIKYLERMDVNETE